MSNKFSVVAISTPVVARGLEQSRKENDTKLADKSFRSIKEKTMCFGENQGNGLPSPFLGFYRFVTGSEAFPTHVYQGTDLLTLNNIKLFGWPRRLHSLYSVEALSEVERQVA